MPTIDEIMALGSINALFLPAQKLELRIAIESAIREERAKERERCAKECDEQSKIGTLNLTYDQGRNIAARDCARAIRALKD